MSIAEVIPFRVPDPQVKEVIVDKEDKNDGYTPLPNFICDEGYLSALSGEAIKCLILLNRHINGFHAENKAIGEALVMKLTGFKDKRTVRRNMAELAKFKLIEIVKEKGKSSNYFLTFEKRITLKLVTLNDTSLEHKKTLKAVASNVPSSSQLVTSNVPSSSQLVTSNVTTVVASDVPTTSDIECTPVKEIDLKENIKKDDEEAQAKFQPQNRQLNFVQYHTDDRTQISFPELCKKYPAQLDFQDQAKASFPDHSPNRIFENLKKMAQWSLDKSNHTPQKWMTIWLDTFMKNMPSDSELAAAEARKQQKSQTQTPKAEKPKGTRRFGKYLKPQQPQQGEIRDV